MATLQDVNEATLKGISAWELLSRMEQYAAELAAEADDTNIAATRDQFTESSLANHDAFNLARLHCVGIMNDREEAERSRVLGWLADTYDLGTKGSVRVALQDYRDSMRRGV
jgi:hypothetical protein